MQPASLSISSVGILGSQPKRSAAVSAASAYGRVLIVTRGVALRHHGIALLERLRLRILALRSRTEQRGDLGLDERHESAATITDSRPCDVTEKAMKGETVWG